MKRWIHASEDAEWTDLLNDLQRDCEMYVDPLYEGTHAGDKINEICGDVARKLDIYIEPSVQAGMGGVWIYKGFNDPKEILLSDYSFSEFDDTILDLAFASSSKADFASKIEDYFKKLIG